jgi:hypothetical protein
MDRSPEDRLRRGAWPLRAGGSHHWGAGGKARKAGKQGFETQISQISQIEAQNSLILSVP